MLVVLTRQDIAYRFHHIADGKITTQHVHLKRDFPSVCADVMQYADHILYIGTDNSVRVLKSRSMRKHRYPNFGEALADAPSLHFPRL
jgi:hypothetical protein